MDKEQNYLDPERMMRYAVFSIRNSLENGHSYRSNLNAHNKGHGCPYCSGQLPSRTKIVP